MDDASEPTVRVPTSGVSTNVFAGEPPARGEALGVADAYLAARHAFEEADDRLKVTAARISEFCGQLNDNTAHTTLTGVRAEILFRADTMAETHAMPAEEWPDAEELQALISRWHETYRAMTEAWKRVPEGWKESFKEPPYQAKFL